MIKKTFDELEQGDWVIVKALVVKRRGNIIDINGTWHGSSQTIEISKDQFIEACDPPIERGSQWRTPEGKMFELICWHYQEYYLFQLGNPIKTITIQKDEIKQLKWERVK